MTLCVMCPKETWRIMPEITSALKPFYLNSLLGIMKEILEQFSVM